MGLMRFFLVLLSTAWFLCGATTAGAATAAVASSASLDVTAKNVDFFYNRFIVTADGDVRVRLSDGTVVTGQTFTMDLKLNRYLVAGDVHVDGPGIHQAGAALAGYPDLDRTFFLPAAGTPERYTYFGGDWSNPHAGREQPGDAYNFPDLTAERPYIYATAVRIVPKTNALFTFPHIYTAGIYTPLPRYMVTFSANPHYFENGFAGARADIALPFNGSEHSLTALHVRNDAFNGTYLALDQHFVWDHDYIVAAIDPLTQEERQYNLIAYKRFSQKLESRLFVQESAAQAGIINRPDNAAAFGEINVNAGLRHSGLSYVQDNYWQYLLGFKTGPDDSQPTGSYDPRWREHPMSQQLSWTGYENRVTKATPLLFRLRSSFGLAHDAYGYGGFSNEVPGPKTLTFHSVGATLFTPPLKLGAYGITAQYDRQRMWFSLPHQVDQAESRITLSRQFARQHLNTYLSYDIRQAADYWGDQQLAAYPVGTFGCGAGGDTCVTPYGTFSGQDAYRGLGTLRALTAAAVYAPSQYFTLSLSMIKNTDFPRPVPGIYGQAPYLFSADLRVRVSSQILLDVSRQYSFNFAGQRWAPQFGIQFSP
ncbi:MAG: hypothetical protein JWN27_3113 [Candidatus Eremiobacteraeota bacterium]|nr:hypothetical protein [Candidatus Eremiobacteraeota bacterium]